ncbi:hypothetical protein [Hymenobacter sp. BT491]|uniref:hypothetical protein n=1 Tax=Hymenobacter sp. BT491 TaxID=2766779 RepID=UPI0016537FB1|nr:hypothetical protein [Hymenobacter sp. BT491]MBC6989808.1 hypothetical protein [Hymenobacter sp. BT491]
MTATSAGGQSVQATPDAIGRYSFPQLAVGTYTLSFTPTPSYVAPANVTVVLQASGTSAGTVTAVEAAPAATYTVTRTDVTPTSFRTTATPEGIRIDCLTTPDGHTLTFFLDSPEPKVGNYNLTTSTQHAHYVGPDGVEYDSQPGPNNATPSASLLITAVSTSPRRLTCTFTLKNMGAVSAVGTSPLSRTITGTFTNITY